MRLVLDQGGQSSRAFVVDEAGNVAASASVSVATYSDGSGIVEQDPEEIVASVERCIAEVAKEVPPSEWHSAGLACQRSSVVAWDRASGDARTPVLSWMDTRAGRTFDQMRLDTQRLRAITGLVASPHYGATKLRWMREHLAKDRALGYGPLASFLLHRLLDERPYRVSHSIAQRTLLYDVHTRDWSDDLLQAFGVPREALPHPVDDRSVHGTLCGVPLALCAGDQNIVPFAAGSPTTDTAYLNLGTGAFLLRPVARAADVPDALLLAPLDDHAFAAEGTVNGAGSAISWFEQETDQAFPWTALARVDPACAPLFVNGIGGVGSPFWRTDVRARFEPDAGDAASRAYAVLESVVFLVRANFDRMTPARRVVATGGLAAQPFVRTLLTRVLGTPVETGPREATVQGLAALLGCAVTAPRAAERGDDTSAGGSAECLAGRYARWCSLLFA
ncbi:MAG: FGGY family carbohydrate kinase [Gammaproteobacteria bacterium]